MDRRENQVLLGAVISAACLLALALLLGFRQTATPHQRPFSQSISPVPAEPLAGVMVILDPGHGGEDPGALCGPVSEAALTYRTAVEAAASLRLQGAEVSFTVHSRELNSNLPLTEPSLQRPTDAVLALTGKSLRRRHTSLPLWQRAEWAGVVWKQRLKQDQNARWNVFFLSLHYDQYRSSRVSGSVVCVDRRDRLPRLSQALAQQMAQDNKRRGCDYQGLSGISGHELGVLNPRYNPVPEKVLLELTTLSNPQDALEAGSAVWRTEMARRITAAILQVHQEKESSGKALATL